MNVQANLSILICYILMGKKFQKFQKSIFQYQSLKNIFFSICAHGSLAIAPWPPVWEPLVYGICMEIQGSCPLTFIYTHLFPPKLFIFIALENTAVTFPNLDVLNYESVAHNRERNTRQGVRTLIVLSGSKAFYENHAELVPDV